MVDCLIANISVDDEVNDNVDAEVVSGFDADVDDIDVSVS